MAPFLKPRAFVARPGLPQPADQVDVQTVARPICSDWATLDGLGAAADPRLWMCRATLSWRPETYAVSLALAAMACSGAESVSAYWLAVRCGVKRAELPGMLAAVAKGPGRFVAEVKGDKVVLTRFDRQLLRPSLYTRYLSIADIARAPDAVAVRGLLVVAAVCSKASRGRFIRTWETADELADDLGLRGKLRAYPAAELQSVWPWISEQCYGHNLVLDTDACDYLNGGIDLGFAIVKASSIDTMRIPFLSDKAMSRYKIIDGSLDGIPLTLGSVYCGKIWRAALRDGLESNFREGRALWLAVVHAAYVGAPSPVPCYSTDDLRGQLRQGGVEFAWNGLCRALLRHSGATKENRRGLKLAVVMPQGDSDMLERYRIGRTCCKAMTIDQHPLPKVYATSGRPTPVSVGSPMAAEVRRIVQQGKSGYLAQMPADLAQGIVRAAVAVVDGADDMRFANGRHATAEFYSDACSLADCDALEPLFTAEQWAVWEMKNRGGPVPYYVTEPGFVLWADENYFGGLSIDSPDIATTICAVIQDAVDAAKGRVVSKVKLSALIGQSVRARA